MGTDNLRTIICTRLAVCIDTLVICEMRIVNMRKGILPNFVRKTQKTSVCEIGVFELRWTAGTSSRLVWAGAANHLILGLQ